MRLAATGLQMCVAGQRPDVMLRRLSLQHFRLGSDDCRAPSAVFRSPQAEHGGLRTCRVATYERDEPARLGFPSLWVADVAGSHESLMLDRIGPLATFSPSLLPLEYDNV
jgi:hypothetical protein